MNDFPVCADHFYAVALQNAIVPQSTCAIQCGLTAERWEQRIDRCTEFLFTDDDLLDRFGRDGFDVGAVAERRISHDRRGV